MFAAGQYVEAAETYSRALKRCEKGDETAQTLHKNRAACYLKLVRNSVSRPLYLVCSVE